jgi:excisionase family DNA binding protein
MGNDSAPSVEKLLTKGEVAQLCRVEIRTVDRWVAAGKVRCYRTPGGRLLFRQTDLLTAAERCQEIAVQSGRSSTAPSRKLSSSDRTSPALRR